MKHLSQEEKNFIKINFPIYGNKYCQEYLKISKTTVTRHAQKLGIKIIKEILPENHKKCCKCHNILKFDNFYTDSGSRDGYGNRCKTCKSQDNHEKRVNIRKSDYFTRKRECLKQILKGIKRRVKKRNLEFNIDLEWLFNNTPEICPILDIQLRFLDGEYNHFRDDSPSVDRIDNTKGYTKDNCIIISWLANKIKNCFTWQQLEKVSNFYKNLER